eukprot:scaffold6052_cov118-Cylindrotheca_fusiformis.AAC.17
MSEGFLSVHGRFAPSISPTFRNCSRINDKHPPQRTRKCATFGVGISPKLSSTYGLALQVMSTKSDESCGRQTAFIKHQN